MRLIQLFLLCIVLYVDRNASKEIHPEGNKRSPEIPEAFANCFEGDKIRKDGICGRLWSSG